MWLACICEMDQLKNVLKIIKTPFSISIIGITCHLVHFASSKIIVNMLPDLHQGQTNPFVGLDFHHRTAHEHCVNLNDCEILVLIQAMIVLLTSNLEHPCNRCHVTLGCSSGRSYSLSQCLVWCYQSATAITS